MTFEKSLEHLQNSLIMLEIGWKFFGNLCWPYFEVIKNISTSLVIVRSLPKIFGSRWKPSAIFGSLLEIFDNLQKPSVNLKKFSFYGDEKSHAFY